MRKIIFNISALIFVFIVAIKILDINSHNTFIIFKKVIIFSIIQALFIKLQLQLINSIPILNDRFKALIYQLNFRHSNNLSKELRKIPLAVLLAILILPSIYLAIATINLIESLQGNIICK